MTLTQPDPLRRTVNPLSPPDASPYIYAGNNPCNYTDPTGLRLRLSQCDLLGTLVGSAVGIATLPLNAVAGGLVGLAASVGAAHLCNTAGDYRVPYNRNWRRYVNENNYTD